MLDTKFDAFQRLMQKSIKEMGIDVPIPEMEMPALPPAVNELSTPIRTDPDEYKPWKHMPLRRRFLTGLGLLYK